MVTIALPNTDPETAIADAGTPRNRAEVRAFIHSAREPSSANPDQALKLRKMHELLRRDTPWAWDEEVDREFRLARSTLFADQPYSVTPSTPNDNEDNQAHGPHTDSNQNPVPTNTQADHPHPPTPSNGQRHTTQAPSTQETQSERQS